MVRATRLFSVIPLAAASLILAACGSSGGGGEKDAAVADTPATDLGTTPEDTVADPVTPIDVPADIPTELPVTGDTIAADLPGPDDAISTDPIEDVCVPNCGAIKCGDDGCGGSCGSCPTGGPACTTGGQCGSDCVLTVSNPACLSFGFEDGKLDKWIVEGDVFVVENLGKILAPDGNRMIELGTPTVAHASSRATIQTYVPAGTKSLRFTWRLLSEELVEACSPHEQTDRFLVEASLLPNPPSPGNVFRRTVSQLCPKDAAGCVGTAVPTGEVVYFCGDYFVGVEQADVAFDQGHVWQTPWQTDTVPIFDLIGPMGGVLGLTFSLQDGWDGTFKTVVLLDAITLLPNCTPVCDGRHCGSDLCGGTCGCAPGQTCADVPTITCDGGSLPIPGGASYCLFPAGEKICTCASSTDCDGGACTDFATSSAMSAVGCHWPDPVPSMICGDPMQAIGFCQ